MKFNLILPLLFLSTLAQTGQAEEPDLLPADQAFAFSAESTADNVVTVTWDIADGYYMYRDKISFDVTGQGVMASVPELPHGRMKQDALFGEVEVYLSSLSVDIPVVANGPEGYTLVAKGQGCNEPPLACVGVECFDPGFANNPVRTLWTQDGIL